MRTPMMIRRWDIARRGTRGVFAFALALGTSWLTMAPAAAQTDMRFERFWPVYHNPWYFSFDSEHVGTAADSEGFLYLTQNGTIKRVDKYTHTGEFIRRIGSTSGDAHITEPIDVTLDSLDNVYVLNGTSVLKFDQDGALLGKFGASGSGDGEFSAPRSLAVAPDFSIYVADTGNSRIQRFKKVPGVDVYVYDLQWAVTGTPHGIEVAPDGNVFVLRRDAALLTKYSASGSFVAETDGGPTPFTAPAELSPFADLNWPGAPGPNTFILDSGYLYVIAPDLSIAGGSGFPTGGGPEDHAQAASAVRLSETQRFIFLAGSNIYGSGVHKMNMHDLSIQSWVTEGSIPGGFGSDQPRGVALGSYSNVYVADNEPLFGDIQEYDLSGEFKLQHTALFPAPSELDEPYGIEVDTTQVAAAGDLIYIVLRGNDTVQVHLDDDPGFVDPMEFWAGFGASGTGAGQFTAPEDVFVDGSANTVYVADTGNDRISIWTRSGTTHTHSTDLTSFNSGDSFDTPTGVVVDSSDNMYVLDSGNNRIVKFDSSQTYVTAWTSANGTALSSPSGIGIDASDNVYFGDFGGSDDRLVKITSAGAFVIEWGGTGTFPGRFEGIGGIDVDGSGNVYVSDVGNKRGQKFVPIVTPSKAKAIIVAAGGPYRGNALWNATERLAAFAYRALIQQGFKKEDIHFLSSNTEQDLDNDGFADDVDGDSTLAQLQASITSFALDSGDTDDVLLYLADHGGIDEFRMNRTETLSASTLDSWLDELQDSSGDDITGTLTIVYDACESGTFQNELAPTGSQSRLVLTSTSIGENAHYLSNGAVGFSTAFWTAVFNGEDVQGAFDAAVASVNTAAVPQTPLLVESTGGLATGLFIGNGADFTLTAPIISDPSDQTDMAATASGSSATFSVRADSNGSDVFRVWANIRPPALTVDSASSDNPLRAFPEVEMLPTGSDYYAATFDRFDIDGAPYEIAVMAKDEVGNTSPPTTISYTVGSPSFRDAIIVVAHAPGDPLQSEYQANGVRAYNALKFQGYTDDDILFYTSQATSGRDATASKVQLSTVLGSPPANTHDLVLYMIGPDDDGDFAITNSETVSASELDSWLNTYQNTTDGVEGPVMAILDFDRAGNFIPALDNAPGGRTRVVMSSTRGDQDARFALNGDVSFSNFLWTRLLNGDDLRSAFRSSAISINLLNSMQSPQLDDDGDGNPNAPGEGRTARTLYIGSGVRLAGEDPQAGDIVMPATISGVSTASITVHNVTTTGTVAEVCASVIPPWPTPLFEIAPVMLSDQGGGTWSGTLTDLREYGPYRIAVVAVDTEGNASPPIEGTILRSDGEDLYEPDQHQFDATWIGVNGFVQTHGFHDGSDEDWVEFAADNGDVLLIKTFNLGSDADTVTELIDTDGSTVLATSNDTQPDPEDANGEFFFHSIPSDGQYFVRVSQGGSNTPGGNAHYDLFVGTEITPTIPPGYIGGVVTDDGTDSGTDLLAGTTIALSGDAFSSDPAIITNPDGADIFLFSSLAPGTYTVAASKMGFTPAPGTHSGLVLSSSATEGVAASFQMTSAEGDDAEDTRNQYDSLDTVTPDGVLEFGEVSGLMSQPTFDSIDLNGDDFLSMEELLIATLGAESLGTLTPVYVDFSYSGTETGESSTPFNSLKEAIAFVEEAGTVVVQAGASSETMRTDLLTAAAKAVTLQASGGTASIGAP